MFIDKLKKINITPTVIAILAIIALVLIYILYNSNKSINKNVDNFNDTEKDNSKEFKHEIVLYYALWCGYSKMFLPEWEKFVAYAKDNFNNVKVTSIRCEGGDEATCKQKGIKGYPMVVLYLEDGTEVNFDDERTSDKLIEFINKNI